MKRFKKILVSALIPGLILSGVMSPVMAENVLYPEEGLLSDGSDLNYGGEGTGTAETAAEEGLPEVPEESAADIDDGGVPAEAETQAVVNAEEEAAEVLLWDGGEETQGEAEPAPAAEEEGPAEVVSGQAEVVSASGTLPEQNAALIVGEGDTKREFVVEKDTESGEVTGCRVDVYSVAESTETLQYSYLWEKASQSWSRKDAGETEGYTLEANTRYNIYENLDLYTSAVDEAGLVHGLGGYQLNTSTTTWHYALTAADVAAGKASVEVKGYLADAPAEFYIGMLSADTSRAGLQTIKEKLYYLNTDGTYVVNGEIKVGKKRYTFSADGSCIDIKDVKEGWVKKSDGYYWCYEDGTYCKKTGFVKFDGDLYYLTGGKRYSGWLKRAGKTYFLSKKTGILARGGRTISGKRYRFHNSKGYMLTGWLQINKKYYYYDPQNGYKLTGWQTLEGKKYYLGNDGARRVGLKTISGKIYYFLRTGAMHTGWAKLSGKRYYFSPKYGYALCKKWATFGGKKYHFNKNGIMQTGIITSSGKHYLMGENGVLQTNAYVYSLGKKYYTTDKNGEATELSKVEGLARSRVAETGNSLEGAFSYAAGLTFDLTCEVTVADGQSEHEANAIYGFENGRGDSHVMAAVLYYMAKALSRDVYLVMGDVPFKSGAAMEQYWLEIENNGEIYVMDPYFENRTSSNGYMFRYESAGTWKYSDYTRVL